MSLFLNSDSNLITCFGVCVEGSLLSIYLIYRLMFIVTSKLTMLFSVVLVRRVVNPLIHGILIFLNVVFVLNLQFVKFVLIWNCSV